MTFRKYRPLSKAEAKREPEAGQPRRTERSAPLIILSAAVALVAVTTGPTVVMPRSAASSPPHQIDQQHALSTGSDSLNTSTGAATGEPAETQTGVGSVTLTWDKAGDNDLFVVGTDGQEISYRRSTPMGSLSLDDIDPTGPEVFNPTSAARGPFQVKVRCFHLCEGSTVTAEAVVRGQRVPLGTHTMTARHEVWAAGSVNFDRTWDCDDNGTTDITLDDVDLLLDDARAVDATNHQLRRINEDPCDPWIRPDPSEFSGLIAGIGDPPASWQKYAVAFSLEDPPGYPGRGLDKYTNWLNTTKDLSFTPPVLNYNTWAVALKGVKPYPVTFPDQFLAAVPPVGSPTTSPFTRIYFNLTGMTATGSLEQAIKNGSKGYSPGNATNWELYNALGSARSKTICSHWGVRDLIVEKFYGFFEVRCPPWPPGLPLPNLEGEAG